MPTTTKFTGFVVKDVMTVDVVMISENEKLGNIIALFTEHHINAIPVYKNHHEYVGVISKTDFVNKKTLELLAKSGDIDSLTVKDILSPRELITVDEDTLVEQASDLMLEKRIHRVFIVDKSKKIVGVLSSYDVMKILATCGTISEMNLFQNQCTLCGSVLPNKQV